ncbi:ammonium transporter [Pandoraea anhela]|uniref:Ammonium transporter n=1 Tax=Pandoraea anhela TaxID=2508295 RepID=A0A5E4X998_9BURK|nr:ammonium transporter [Pandoraea anhela]VVE32745.1 ammonia channel protein [Pandoraea anhela]
MKKWLFCLFVGFSMLTGHTLATAQTAEQSAATVQPTAVASGADASIPSPAAKPAPAAPSAPMVVASTTINAGDTAWMLVSTALVLLMTIPGLALFYGGMVRKKNVLTMMMQSFSICCLITVLWVVAGYSLAFTPGNGFIGGTSRLFLHGMGYENHGDGAQLTVSHLAVTIPEAVYVMYQMTFAIITPALITGAFADRMKFSSMLLFSGLWSLVVYVPIAHMVWEPTGWLAGKGILDFAGGTVVHINAGIAGLVCALVLGKRLGYGQEDMAPHNLGFSMIGAALLWVGWFGFNAGSALAADGRAGFAMLTTQVAAASGALMWMLAEWRVKGKPTVLGLISGAVAGLVAITPAAGFVDAVGAIWIGLLSGALCYGCVAYMKVRFGYDDSLDAFGIHGVGGIVGALLTGVFAKAAIGGNSGSLIVQAQGVLTTLIFSGVMTGLLLWAVDATLGLRVNPSQEHEGLDLALHGERLE